MIGEDSPWNWWFFERITWIIQEKKCLVINKDQHNIIIKIALTDSKPDLNSSVSYIFEQKFWNSILSRQCLIIDDKYNVHHAYPLCVEERLYYYEHMWDNDDEDNKMLSALD